MDSPARDVTGPLCARYPPATPGLTNSSRNRSRRISFSSASKRLSKARGSWFTRRRSCGPDRRRTKGFIEEDKRRLKESDCEIVYSGTDPGKFREDKPPVWLFRTPKRLKDKLQGGDFEFSSDGGMADNYSDWVKETITDLVGAHEEAQNSFGKAEEQMKGAIEKINTLAHDLRGQGGVFGYPLISEFGKSLYNCTGNSARVAENLFEFVKAHIDGITAVINGNVKGDGVSVGKKFLSGLEAAKKKDLGEPSKAA